MIFMISFKTICACNSKIFNFDLIISNMSLTVFLILQK
ncbi:hypothetical protein X975_02976, partial [Stegodyphus mimosarum]